MSNVKLTYWPTTKVHLESFESSELQGAGQPALTETEKNANCPDFNQVKFDIASLGLVKREPDLNSVAKYWNKVPI